MKWNELSEIRCSNMNSSRTIVWGTIVRDNNYDRVEHVEWDQMNNCWGTKLRDGLGYRLC